MTWRLRCPRCGASASLPLGMTCAEHVPVIEVDRDTAERITEGLLVDLSAGEWWSGADLEPLFPTPAEFRRRWAEGWDS